MKLWYGQAQTAENVLHYLLIFANLTIKEKSALSTNQLHSAAAGLQADDEQCFYNNMEISFFKTLMIFSWFLPRDASAERGYEIAFVCPSVCNDQVPWWHR